MKISFYEYMPKRCLYLMSNGVCSFKPRDHLGLFSHECHITQGIVCMDFKLKYTMQKAPTLLTKSNTEPLYEHINEWLLYKDKLEPYVSWYYFYAELEHCAPIRYKWLLLCMKIKQLQGDYIMLPLKDFKNWFKMFPPESATEEEWNIFEQNCKTKFPIRYWLNEELIPNTWDYFKNSLVTFTDKIRHYVVERLHMIDIKLPPGYYGFETRLLYGLFSLLVDFVEQECAWMEEISSKDRGLKGKTWYEKLKPFKPSREKGLKYLDWEINLKNEKTKDIGEGAVNTSQSDAAEMTKKLYLWWVDERPKREDPYKMMDEISMAKGRSLKDWLSKDDPKKLEVIKKIYAKEEEYDAEDTAMLIELVKLRKSLWT